jgi:hypothetical protein
MSEEDLKEKKKKMLDHFQSLEGWFFAAPRKQNKKQKTKKQLFS